MIILVIREEPCPYYRNGLRVSTHDTMEEVRDDIIDFLSDAPDKVGDFIRGDSSPRLRRINDIQAAFKAANAKMIIEALDDALGNDWTILTDNGYLDEDSTIVG